VHGYPPTMGHLFPGILRTRYLLVPPWYRRGMAMNLRLSDAESDALRAKAEQEGRSMQEVARTAIAQYVSDRPQRLLSAIQRVRTEDRELLERLSQ
jgi:predicted transcriptional regulator